jgi:hypothetical protein
MWENVEVCGTHSKRTQSRDAGTDLPVSPMNRIGRVDTSTMNRSARSESPPVRSCRAGLLVVPWTEHLSLLEALSKAFADPAAPMLANGVWHHKEEIGCKFYRRICKNKHPIVGILLLHAPQHRDIEHHKNRFLGPSDTCQDHLSPYGQRPINLRADILFNSPDLRSHFFEL